MGEEDAKTRERGDTPCLTQNIRLGFALALPNLLAGFLLRTVALRTVALLQEQIAQEKAVLEKLKAVRPVDVQVAIAQVKSAQAQVERITAELDDFYVRVPVAGQIIYQLPCHQKAALGKMLINLVFLYYTCQLNLSSPS